MKYRCFLFIRIGNDINHPGIKSAAEPYADITYGKTTGSIAEVPLGRYYQGMIRFARSAAQNYYIHNHIALSDPDSFFSSPQYSLEEARCHVALQALMGGFLFGGDRIESLPLGRSLERSRRPNGCRHDKAFDAPAHRSLDRVPKIDRYVWLVDEVL